MINLDVIEQLGAFSALLYLLLATRRTWICWPVYILSSCLYVPVFWSAHFYGDAVLQAYFLTMGIYGWLSWKAEKTIRVVSWGQRENYSIIHGWAIGSAVLGYGLSYTSAGLYGYSDAFVTVGSILTTVLTARKVLEGWWYWIVIDTFATIVFWWRGFGLITVLLYGVYTILSMRALREWQRAYLSERSL